MTNPPWREWLAAEVWQSSSFRGKVLLFIGCAAGFALTWWAAAAVGFPPNRDGPVARVADDCLLHQHAPWPGLLMTIILIPLLVTAGSVVAGSIRRDAGLFIAGFSLMGLSLRGGAMRITIYNASGPAVLLLLALEVVILYGIIVASRLIVTPMHRMGLVVDDTVRDPTIKGDSSRSQKFMAVATSGLGMIVVLAIFAVNDDKHQAIGAMFLAAAAGSFIGRAMYPVDDGLWYLLACPIVAVLGYITGFASPSGFNVGQLDGLLSPLTRALPLDYAGAGLCGSILGYWIARRWQRPMEEDEQDQQPATEG
jgi:hypothetical protein